MLSLRDYTTKGVAHICKDGVDSISTALKELENFDDIGITKLPSVKTFREEYADLLAQEQKAYASYKKARTEKEKYEKIAH